MDFSLHNVFRLGSIREVMRPFRVPDTIADRMVELLFEDVSSTYGKRLLYPGCGEGELIGAVERYFGDIFGCDCGTKLVIATDTLPADL